MPGPQLWLVRHGETEWSAAHRHTGRTDLPLTPSGERAARAVAARLGDEPFDLVLTSPLQRARRTAELAGFADALVEPRAVEWDYGEYEGITTDEIRREVPGWSVWTHPVPGGESREGVARRADAVVERVRGSGAHRALLVAHGHFLRVLAARWLGLDAAVGGNLRLDTATVSTLGEERERTAIVRWNA